MHTLKKTNQCPLLLDLFLFALQTCKGHLKHLDMLQQERPDNDSSASFNEQGVLLRHVRLSAEQKLLLSP